MKKINFILSLFLLIGYISCAKEIEDVALNEDVAFKLKNGYYTGIFSYDNNYLFESFVIQKDSFAELASGGQPVQKFPEYCLTKGTYEIIDDSIYFENIQAAIPPNVNFADYEKEYLLMGSYIIEDYSDTSIIFSRIEKNGNQKYDLKLYYETN